MNSASRFSVLVVNCGGVEVLEMANTAGKRPSQACEGSPPGWPKSLHPAFQRRASQSLRRACAFGSIKKDVKRKSSLASWKPGKVSGIQPLAAVQCLEA
jgi:hypothetical protein